jgi:hypothetical protein
MIRALLICLLLLAAAPAAAQVVVRPASGRVLIINDDQYGSQSVSAVGYVTLALGRLGINYTIVNPENTNQDSLRFGSVDLGYGWVRHAVVVHLLRNGALNGNYSPGAFTRALSMPFVPHIMIQHPSQFTLSFGTSSTCSTGTGNGVQNSANAIIDAGRYYMPGFPYRFHASGQGIYYVRVAGNTNYTWRPLVGLASCNATATPLPDDPESARAGSYPVSPDSAAVWEIAFNKNVTVSGTVFATSSTILCAQSTGAASPMMRLFFVALARADSLAGGTILRNASPIRKALVVSAFNQYSLTSQGCAPSDTADFKTSLDSLSALSVPVGVCVAAESLATKPYVTSWFRRLGAYGYLISSSTSAASVAANASQTFPIDPLSWRRRRQALPASGNCSSAADTSVLCLLRMQRNLLKSYFPNARIANGVFGDGFIWYQQGTSPRVDSLVSAIHGAGFRAIYSYTRQEPAQNIMAPASTLPWAYQAQRGKLYGLPAQVASGDTIVASGAPVSIENHEIAPGPAYYEDYQIFTGFRSTALVYDPAVRYMTQSSRPSVLTMYGQNLAGDTGDGTILSKTKIRPAFYEAKFMVDAARMFDAYCWPTNRGRILKFVTIDDLGTMLSPL